MLPPDGWSMALKGLSLISSPLAVAHFSQHSFTPGGSKWIICNEQRAHCSAFFYSEDLTNEVIFISV